MPKPDLALRTRPLKEVENALEKLKRVVLFHPDEIVLEVPAKYCVCGQGERKGGKRTKLMIQCEECFEWFHYDCVGLADDYDGENNDWKCEWCTGGADKQGRQRWESGRKKAKLRHVNDRPVAKGAQLGENPPQAYTAPVSWEGKVAEVKEIARRNAIKKRKLEEAVQELADGGGHHVADAEGLGGLEARPVDDALVDDFVAAGFVDPDAMSDD